MKKVAIIGTGSIASQHIESYLHFADRAQIVALCDIDPQRTDSRARALLRASFLYLPIVLAALWAGL